MEITPDIAEKLKRCELPPLSDLTQKIVTLTQDIHSDPNDVANLVRMDMSLSASVLKVANSVAYGYSGKISSINDAVNRIGMNPMRDLVLSVSLLKNFNNLQGIDYVQFWNHCLSVGLASEIIERHAQFGGNSDYTYTAGLLHKAGILLLAQNFPEAYQEVLNEVQKEEKDLWELEKSIIGVSHNEASHFVFEEWKFPQEVSQTALYYNDPINAPDDFREIIYTVHIANFACLNQGIGVGIDRFPVSFFDEAWEKIGLKVDEIQTILDEVAALTGKAKGILDASK